MAKIRANLNTKVGYVTVEAETPTEFKATVEAIKADFGLKAAARYVEETIGGPDQI